MGQYDDRLKDYVDVKERIRLFYEKHPDGRLVTGKVKLTTDPDRVWVQAFAYRTPDDPHPGQGWSWMLLPGTTPYTRGSEIENAETSAWGRAIGSLGIGIEKSIASADEVASKEGAIATAPIETTHDGGLIGTVEKGKPPVDMSLRQTPDGPAWGFKLKNGRKAFQALAIGPIADAISLAGLAVGERVIVWGTTEMVPWDKDGKAMPPFARIAIEKVQTNEWTLPAPTGATETPAEPVEAETAPLFELDAEERALVAGGLE